MSTEQITSRPYTPDELRPSGRTIHVKRACNGCSELIGDVTEQEINDAIDGLPLTDVRSECPWCGPKMALNEILAEQAAFDEAFAELQRIAASIEEILDYLQGQDLDVVCGNLAVVEKLHEMVSAPTGAWLDGYLAAGAEIREVTV